MNRRAFLSLGAAILPGCRRQASGPEVVLYSSLDEGYAVELARLFEKQSGIHVRLVSDTETTKSTGLVSRLIAEKGRPQADVFLSGDVMRSALLKKLGLSTVWRPQAEFEKDDPDGHYACMAARLRLILVHPGRAAAAPRPHSVLDLARPEFAPATCIANPLFGTTSLHAAVLFHALGEAKARQFFEDFTRFGGRMLSSNGEVRRRVASGEFAYGLTDSDDVSVALRDSKPVEFIIPDQQGMGVVLVPCAVSVIAGAPHPAEAVRLAEFLISPQAEAWLAQSEAAHLPMRSKAAGPAAFPDTGRLKTTLPDASALAAQSEILAGGFLKAWVEQQAR